MANFNNIKHEIDQNVNTNGQQAITGAILNQTLKDMLDDVDSQKQDTLVAGQNITISGNVISATGGGSGQQYYEGFGININSNNEISVDSYDLAGAGLAVSDGGELHVDWDSVQDKLVDGENIKSINGEPILGSGDIDIPEYVAGNGIIFTSVGGDSVISADFSQVQEKIGEGDAIDIDGSNNVNVLYGSGLQIGSGGALEVDTQTLAGNGLQPDGNGGLEVDFNSVQPKLTAGSGISISAQNVISATGGGGGASLGDGDAIHIDSNDNINVLYGNGLQLDGNGNLEVDTAQVATDISGIGIYEDQGTLNADYASFRNYFLPLDGGELQDPNGDTELTVMDGMNEDYVRLGAYETQGEQPHIEIFENGSGDTKFYYDHIERGSQVSIDLPSSSGTLALTSDIPSASDLDGWGLTATGGGELEVDGSVLAGSGITWDPLNKVFNATGGGGQSLVAGNGIDIDQNNVISVDVSDIAGSGLAVGAYGLNPTVYKLTADLGNGLQFDQNGAIEIIPGAGGLWTSGTGTNSLMAPQTNVWTAGTASAQGAISMGATTTASGTQSVAMGTGTTASGDNSVAAGNNTNALGLNSIATGRQSTAQGPASVAMGDIAQATGSYSVALGSNATASGDRSFATSNATASNTDAIALGNGASSSGLLSTAIGTGAKATNASEIALGKYNKSTSTGTDADKTQFSVGNGSALGSELNIIEAKKNNDVYVYGVGGFTGANSSQAQTLQDVINNASSSYTAGSGINISSGVISVDASDLAGSGLQVDANGALEVVGGGGGTSFTAGDGLELDSNDNLNVLYGSGLTLSANNELEVDPSSITGFLPLAGGMLQEDPNNSGTTELYIQTPESNGSIIIDATDTDPNNAESQVHIDMSDSYGSLYIYTNGVSDGNYTAAWPSLAADGYLVSNQDLDGYLPITGGTIQYDETTAADTDLSIDSPNSAAGIFFNAHEDDPGNTNEGYATMTIRDEDANGNPHTATYTSTGISDGNYTISFPTLSGDDTFALASQISGGGSGLWTSGTGTNSVMSPGAWQANGSNSISAGDNTRANGASSVALGSSTTASGYISTALGGGSSATNSYSVAIGHNVHSANEDELALGKFNNYINSGTTAEKTFFTLGNGTGTNAKSNLIEAKQNNDIYVVGVGGFDGTNASQSQTLQSVINNSSSSYTAGSGIDITSGTISVDETYLDSVYLPIIGGSLENTSNHTDLRVDAPNAESDNFVDILSPGTGVPSVELGTDTNTQGEVESLKFKGDADIDIKYVGDNTTYTLSFPTLTQNETIATLSDISGSGTTYTAGSGINIDANNAISSTTLINGTGAGSITSATNSASAVSGMRAIGIGFSSWASANYATAFGPMAGASANYAMALGPTSEAFGQYSVAIGRETQTKNTNETSIGSYNNSINSGTTAEKTQFTVGVGTANNARANLIEAKQNKDIYIYGVGGFDGTNAGASGVETLQQAIANAGGGGGGSSLWTSGTGTDSLVAPGTVSAGLTGDAAGTGAVSCGYDSNANGDYSFACGGASLASGDYSFAANNGTADGDYSAAFGTSGASGDRSFAAGDGSLADAAYSIALGGGQAVFDDSDPQNPIDAQYGVAIGNGSIVEGEYGTAIGGALSRGTGTVAIGSGSLTEGMYSTAFAGSSAAANYSFAASTGQANVNAHYSTALGGGNTVGEGSLASGFDTSAYGYCSAALGYSLSTYDQADGALNTDPNAGEVALGRYNYSEAGIVFTVGCGYLDETDPDNPTEVRENAIAIDSDGKIFLKGLGGYTGTSVSGCTDLVSFLNSL